jgi:hypothetical protein
VPSDKQQDKRREAYLQRKLEAATEHQRAGSTVGSSAYLERKQVASIFETHEVVGATDLTGAELPGMTFGEDNRDTFVQFALCDVSGALRGYQRIYDSKCLTGERDKDFIIPTGQKKGAFVLLLPKGVKTRNLFTLLLRGYDIGVCEGVATGMSVCLAKPNTVMVCALDAGNLTHVLTDLRARYGYTRKVKGARKAVAITIWADNDAWGKENVGLTKAHKAALRWHCSVRTPNFKCRKLGGAKATDFNDLHVLFGLEAVKRTRKKRPDTRLAFHKELGKQTVDADKHLAPFELPGPSTALLVRAPMETGKTHQLAHTLENARAANLRVLVVVHRESLANALATRLKLENYNDYAAADLRYVNQGLVICFDSLHKLSIGGKLPHYDVLVLDECEQVLRHTKEPHIKNKQANFATLKHYLGRAPRFIGLDAHVGAITAYALARFAPDKQVSWHRHDYHIGRGRTARLVWNRHEIIDALVRSTEPTWYASDSLKHTRNLDAHLNDLGTLTINSETTSTDPVQVYLADPTHAAPRYTRLIASPSVQTGLSDDSNHWEQVIGDFSGAIGTPQDYVQSLLRPRGTKRLNVWISPAKRRFKEQGDFIREAEAADRAEAKLRGQDNYATCDPDYLALNTFVKVQESRARADTKGSLARELTLLGYDVTLDLPQDVSKKKLKANAELRQTLQDAGMARYVSDRVRAARIDWQRAKHFEDKHRLSQAELFELEQYQLRDFYRLPDTVTDAVLAKMLERDSYGKLRKQVTAYEHFVQPRAVAMQHSDSHLDGAPLQGDSRAPLLVFEFYQRLGAVMGLDAETEQEVDTWHAELTALECEIGTLQNERGDASTIRKGVIDRELTRLRHKLEVLHEATLKTRYDAAGLKEFVSWCVVHRDALTQVLGEMPTKEQLEAGYIISHIRSWLKGAGLKQSSKKTIDGRSYAVTLSSILAM